MDSKRLVLGQESAIERPPRGYREAEKQRVAALVSALKECSRSKDLVRGRSLHSQAIDSGLFAKAYVFSSLINMYSKCGSMTDARSVFDASIQQRNVVSWNCLIQGYVEDGQSGVALEMFDAMRSAQCGSSPDSRTFVAAISACAALAARDGGESNRRWLERGKEIHSQAVTNNCCDLYVENTVLDLYAKCGFMAAAKDVFDKMVTRNVVSWGALIHGYVLNGESELALKFFDDMQDATSKEKDGCFPNVNARFYMAAVTACANLAAEATVRKNKCSRWLAKGKEIHSLALSNGCCDIFMETALVDMYAKCNSMAESREVFDRMIRRDVVSWTALLQGYVDRGDCEIVLELFERMVSEKGNGCVPNARTFVAVLTACATLAGREDRLRGGVNRWLETGKSLHSRAARNRCCDNRFVQNTLVDLYGKCGSMDAARSVFEKMVSRDAVSWTALLQGYVDNGSCDLALELFDRMVEEVEDSVLPNARTYVVALTACGAMASGEDEQLGGLISAASAREKKQKQKWLIKGKRIHSRAVRDSFWDDRFVQNTLVDMYARCGSMTQACCVFDNIVHPDVVTWNAFLQGFVENGESKLAVELFDGMEEECERDARTFVAALTACTALGIRKDGNSRKFEAKWLRKGRRIQSQAVASSCCDMFVETVLVNLFAQFGELTLARDLFDAMVVRNVVSWNCLAQGYIDNGENEAGLEVIEEMVRNGFGKNCATFVAAFVACGNLMAVEIGKAFHGEAEELGFVKDVMVATCLIEFYGKCGMIEAAKEVFDSIVASSRDIWAWNTLISGYTQQGDTMQVFELFEKMRGSGVKPNEYTFTHLLTACSHAGLTGLGKEYFEAMQTRFGICPNIIHYNCLVDVLGRSNYLDEALEVVKRMPLEANVVTWTTMLSGCDKAKNVAVGRVAYESLLELDVEESVAYVLMANIYAGVGLWEERDEVLLLRRRRNVGDGKMEKKSVWIDGQNKTHKFFTR